MTFLLFGIWDILILSKISCISYSFRDILVLWCFNKYINIQTVRGNSYYVHTKN